MEKENGRETRHYKIEGWREKEGENERERKKHRRENGVGERRKGGRI